MWLFVRPLHGAFAARTWDQGVIEVSTLLAMGVWLLIFGLFALLVHAIVPRLEHGGTASYHREHGTHV